jgi:branched-chain amino acid transport system permease protein
MNRLNFDIIGGLALVVAGLALPLSGMDYVVGIAFNLAMWVALVQSWSILSAMTGYVSLGHVVFCGIGSYVFVLTNGMLPLPVALACAGIAAGVAALVIGLPVLRVRGPYFVILTFGLAELAKNVIVQIETSLGQFSRLIFDAPTLETLYYIMLGLAVVATGAAVFIRHSKLGRGLIAIRENEEAAEAIGVPVARLKLIAFVAAAIIPGIVGGVLLLRTSYFEAAQAFDPVVSFSIVTMAIVGGMGTVRGPILGSFAFVLLSELLWARFPQLYMIILGVLLILFILFLPRGLSGLFERKEARA